MAEQEKMDLMKEIKQEQTGLLHLEEELQQKWTELENITAETEELERKLEELRGEEGKEELKFAQTKAGIHSIYQTIAPYWRESIDAEDPFKQLQLIRKHLDLMKAIAEDQKTPSAGETEDDSSRD